MKPKEDKRQEDPLVLAYREKDSALLLFAVFTVFWIDLSGSDLSTYLGQWGQLGATVLCWAVAPFGIYRKMHLIRWLAVEKPQIGGYRKGRWLKTTLVDNEAILFLFSMLALASGLSNAFDESKTTPLFSAITAIVLAVVCISLVVATLMAYWRCPRYAPPVEPGGFPVIPIDKNRSPK